VGLRAFFLISFCGKCSCLLCFCSISDTMDVIDLTSTGSCPDIPPLSAAAEMKSQPITYDITNQATKIKRLIQQECDISDLKQRQRRCVLSRFSDDALRRLWELVKDNYYLLETEEHKTNGVSPCWIWKQIPHVAGIENGYPVLSYRRSVSKSQKQAYIKIHQLSVFVTSGMRTGLWNGADTVRASEGSRRAVWKLVASHLCHNKLCFYPGHLIPEPNGWNADRSGCKGGANCRCRGKTSPEKACLLSEKGL